ncbi:MAG: hypothetical protein CBD95_005110 [Flavobacteriales bacterium TMED235]|nr:MAG: hypothetical protein CBD95_005110 [Flavobacteriales bacterium TMED235]
MTICLSQENDMKLIKERIYQVLISNDSNLSFPYTFSTDEELDKILNKIDTLSKDFRANSLENYQFSQLIIDLPSGNFSGSSKTIKL